MELREVKLENENDIILLTDIVRNVYSGYLEKTLTENFNTYCNNIGIKADQPPVDWLKKCTLLYENEALKSCMVLEYYRERILEIISDIRKNTSGGKLADKIKLYSSDNNLTQNLQHYSVNASTQTDGIATNQVQENIIDTNFNSLKKQKITFDSNNSCSPVNKKFKMSNLNCSSSSHCETMEDLFKNDPDDILKDLEDLFKENDEIELELDEMFKENIEIDEFDELFGDNANNTEDSNEFLKDIESLTKNIKVKNEEKLMLDNDNKNLEAINEKILRDSIWPCELHMRKQKLCAVLSQADDVLLMERIKNRFTELFGNEDLEDDFKWYSPSLELNDVLLSSCMKRIAPWIVKHLMQPLNDGLISNRFLFKKLAKHLAHQIIIEHQYPDERYVLARIQDFFCRHKRIDTIEDIGLT